jgi:hypothetical protein
LEVERRENGIGRQGGVVHPRPKRVIFYCYGVISPFPFKQSALRIEVPGPVTPGFNETRDGPLGASSEVVEAGGGWSGEWWRAVESRSFSI